MTRLLIHHHVMMTGCRDRMERPTCRKGSLSLEYPRIDQENEADMMFDLHPDQASYRVQIRQEIIQQGVSASRQPGDVSALRELVGRVLISTGERIRGQQIRMVRPDAQTARVAEMAR
jgi:hypothetical protein